jgi:hypothetical protein
MEKIVTSCLLEVEIFDVRETTKFRGQLSRLLPPSFLIKAVLRIPEDVEDEIFRQLKGMVEWHCEITSEGCC